MDPVEVLPPWVSEDDLLLKNAVEAGASLESLARGAVRFSRRYSFGELKDRWLSLLYDEKVSKKAAIAMRKLELAKSAAAAVGEGGGEKKKFQSGGGFGEKRKFQSIREQYYTMQKKLRRHRSSCMSSKVNNGVVGREGKENVVVDGNLDSDVVNSSVVGYGNCLGLEGVEVGQLNDVPLWKTLEDVILPYTPVRVSVEGKSCGSEGRVDLKDECGNGELKLNATEAECLLNLTNDDELLFMDVEGKEVMAVDKDKDKDKDKPCYDNVDSLLLSSPSDVRELQKLDVEAKLAVPSGCASDGMGDATNQVGGSCGDQHFVSDSENNAALSSAARSPHSEHSEGFMICVLNTEHPDIPCNLDTNLSIVVPELAALKSQPIVKDVSYSETAISNQRRSESDGSLKKEAVLSQSFPTSQTSRQGLVPNVNSSYRTVVLGLRSENPGRNSVSSVSRQNSNVDVNPNHGRSARATVMRALDGHLKQEDIDSPASAHIKALEHKALSKSDTKSLSLDQDGGNIRDYDDDDDNDDYNDDELPNFSDVETMILEMDLSPMDQDANARREVLRYQHEESRRTIMRLEQAAQSSIGRAIRSQGALAVVYGRILKEYIRKNMVILGRATNDVHVDIDLGKEGEEASTKISRRQALIKLESDGSFIIKNLGKRSIFLNGKEIASGQARGLGASSVIEIRGISLIFETNNRCVKRFLENVNEKI